MLNLSGPDAGLPGVRGTCTPGAVGQGKAVYNKASVTTKGDGQPKEAAACGTLPTNPRFKASKTPLDVVRNSDGTFTSSYTVTVANTSLAASPVVADLTDTPQMPTGTRLSGIKVLEKGTDARDVTLPAINPATGTLNGSITLIKAGTGETLAAAPRTGGSGGRRTFTIRMTFTVRESTPGYNEADFQCGHQRADGKPSGLVNTIAMEGDADGEGNNLGCLSTSGRLTFSKEVTTQPGNGSTFDVVYTVSVVNEGALTVSTGPIDDKPSFAPGLTPTLVKVQRETSAARTVTAQPDGSYRLSDNENLYSGLTIRYTVTFTVKIDRRPPDTAMTCCRAPRRRRVSSPATVCTTRSSLRRARTPTPGPTTTWPAPASRPMPASASCRSSRPAARAPWTTRPSTSTRWTPPPRVPSPSPTV